MRTKVASISSKRIYIPEALEQWNDIKKGFGLILKNHRELHNIPMSEIAQKTFLRPQDIERIEAGTYPADFLFFLKILNLSNIQTKLSIFVVNENPEGQSVTSS